MRTAISRRRRTARARRRLATFEQAMRRTTAVTPTSQRTIVTSVASWPLLSKESGATHSVAALNDGSFPPYAAR
jgi:hypothetical protein